MNPDNGRIRDWPEDEAEQRRLAAMGYQQLPSELNRAARRALARGEQVDLKGRSKLAQWARTRR